VNGKRTGVISAKSPLPKQVDLGFAVVHVKYVGDKKLREEGECEDDEATPEGLWVDIDDTIYIRKSMSLARKRYIILHELVHAMIDLRDQFAREGKDIPK